MSTLRHRAREVALQILYGFEKELDQKQQDDLEPIQLSNLLIKHFDHFKVDQKTREFATELVSTAVPKRAELDSALEEFAANWKLSRMSPIDRCILRLGACELLFLEAVPSTVTIDEAVELAKRFGSEDSPAFVNGILDAIRKGRGVEK